VSGRLRLDADLSAERSAFALAVDRRVLEDSIIRLAGVMAACGLVVAPSAERVIYDEQVRQIQRLAVLIGLQGEV
jgi:hypothetical protein